MTHPSCLNLDTQDETDAQNNGFYPVILKIPTIPILTKKPGLLFFLDSRGIPLYVRVKKESAPMTEVEELESRIRNLPDDDFSKFRDWFLQLDDDRWDRQIEADCQAGKFDALIEKARAEFAQGKVREL